MSGTMKKGCPVCGSKLEPVLENTFTKNEGAGPAPPLF